MAEMTAAEKAVEWLTSDKAFGQECYSRKQIAALIEQQAQEIERLQIREHRMIEYMRDIKNFAFTINEVANNAIEEAEVQGWT